MKADKNTILAINEYINKMRGEEMMNDYLIPLIIDDKMETDVDSINIEDFDIAEEVVAYGYNFIEDFSYFVKSYTEELLKVVADVLTSFEDDDIIDLVGMQDEKL